MMKIGISRTRGLGEGVQTKYPPHGSGKVIS